MISPHARARQRALFTMSLDADRARRAAGLPEPEREPIGRRKPMAGDTILARLQASIRPIIQDHTFNGG